MFSSLFRQPMAPIYFNRLWKSAYRLSVLPFTVIVSITLFLYDNAVKWRLIWKVYNTKLHPHDNNVTLTKKSRLHVNTAKESLKFLLIFISYINELNPTAALNGRKCTFRLFNSHRLMLQPDSYNKEERSQNHFSHLDVDLKLQEAEHSEFTQRPSQLI